MVKENVVPCSKEEMQKLMEVVQTDDFYYTLFFIAKTTGRRLGEYYGTPEKLKVGEEKYVDTYGRNRVRDVKKTTGNYIGGVKVSDLDFEKKIMYTQVLKRRMPIRKEALLTDEACRLLKQYIAKTNLKNDDYVFRKVGYRAIQYAVSNAGKTAGIPHKVSFHNFRHYFITEMIRLGLSHDQISKLTGHASIGTVMGYDHTVASDVRNIAIDKINKL